METQCQNEILELHRFFVDWFTAKLANTDESYSRFDRVISPEMMIISPDGQVQPAVELIANLRQAHGSREASPTPYRIWIENFKLHFREGPLALVTYEEWQEVEGRITTRFSTALFRERADAPNGVEWLHVHETWLKPETD